MKEIIKILKEKFPKVEFKLATIFYKKTAVIKPDYYVKNADIWAIAWGKAHPRGPCLRPLAVSRALGLDCPDTGAAGCHRGRGATAADRWVWGGPDQWAPAGAGLASQSARDDRVVSVGSSFVSKNTRGQPLV